MSHNVAYVGAPLEREMKSVVQIPVLKIVFRDLSAMKSIAGVLVFSSKRAIVSLKMSNVQIKSNRTYCIGAQTSDYLKKFYSLECEVPEVQNTDGLTDLLVGREKSVNVISSDQISKKFLERLRKAGIEVHHTIAYRIIENEEADYRGLELTDRVLVGSSKSFEILFRRAGNLLKQKELYAIGKPTAETMLSLGFEPRGTFDSPDIEKILTHIATKR